MVGTVVLWGTFCLDCSSEQAGLLLQRPWDRRLGQGRAR